MSAWADRFRPGALFALPHDEYRNGTYFRFVVDVKEMDKFCGRERVEVTYFGLNSITRSWFKWKSVATESDNFGWDVLCP